MKDLLKRIIISGVSGTFIGYLGYLFFTGKTIVSLGFSEFNMLYFVVLAVVGVYLFILFGIHPLYMKINKISLFVLGLSFILIGDTVLLNDAQNYVYIKDLVKIVGVFLTILAWTNFFVADKAKKEKEESKLEIIEV